MTVPASTALAPVKLSMGEAATPSLGGGLLIDPQPIATNTLVFTNLSSDAFDAHGRALRQLLADNYGQLRKLVILKSFGRMMAIFAETSAAVKAKEVLHKTEFLGMELRIYYGQHTDLSQLNPDGTMLQQLLQVPVSDRNFLLSPPGSPPVGWEQPMETTPALGGHAETFALSTLSLAEFRLDGGIEVDLDSDNPNPQEEDLTHSSEESMTSDGRQLEILKFGTSSSITNSGQMSVDGNALALPAIIIEPPLCSDGTIGLTATTQCEHITNAKPPVQLPRTSMPPTGSY
ncbi:hypothetical protein BASA50_007361 [Batrachochytrium salamandrivorans]|uniref:RRM domain-containing protein n=1 Tax=Batrachochytrium salamandrivorans TaxID=1357716 RepID=A0ABQ8F7Q7_9FUNG|nr:hypothetical protein BASA60_010401 [Batrachochytrium salamandrivorans]KAH6578695.1 hypothetical protein BASA61_000160 [Batrachochytrium salamandrivorans]KAH6593410.1 hypothetical protein BASA50_007361 [Batrachochytrium salamandrivorans]KAH9256765.1 hypothetical protein BASA81_005059 [Batrachochytrium salamandrivorans]KAH9269110.1 hypothetical protein BASA83_008861 [Batrachochytrium salamandrivorans]